jgi:hypothetical protein
VWGKGYESNRPITFEGKGGSSKS